MTLIVIARDFIASKAVISRDGGKPVELVRELGKRRELIESTAKGLRDNACQYCFTRVMQVVLAAVSKTINVST